MTFRREPDIEFYCPHCRKLVRFHYQYIGCKGKCPYCDGRFIVPSYANRAHPVKILPVSQHSNHFTRDKNSTFQAIRLSGLDIPPPKHNHKSYCQPCTNRASIENPLDIFCPRCHKLLSFSYQDIWNKGTCPDCGSHFTISEPDYIARYFAEVKSGSADADVFGDVNSSDVRMSDPPSNRKSSKYHFSFDLFFDPIVDFLKMYFTVFGIVLVAIFLLYGFISEIAPSFGFYRREEPTLWSFCGFTSGIGVLVSLYFLFASLVIPLFEGTYVRNPVDWGEVFTSVSSLALSVLLTFTFFHLSTL